MQPEKQVTYYEKSILIHSSNLPLWEEKVRRAGLWSRVDKTEPMRGVTFTVYTADRDALAQFCAKNNIA